MAGTLRCDRVFVSKRCRSNLIPRAIYRPGGGPMGNSPGQDGRSSRLIIPGQTSPPASRPPPTLVVPGQEKGLNITEDADSSAPLQNVYRPPAGFMDEDEKEEKDEEKLSVDEMLMRLKTGAGYWHEQGKWFAPLLAEGIDSNAIEEMSGICRVDQNTMSVAANVHESMRTSEDFPKEKLEYFDHNGEFLLYELRFLTGKPRMAAAEYICDEELDPRHCQELARAIKEHIRRNGKKEGFSSAPGDCLAFKLYRNALETREEDVKTKFIERGIEVAVTEEAREKLEELQYETENEEEETRPNMAVLRLSRDELGMRPVPVAGTLGEVTAEDIADCPTTSQEGPFGVFSLGAAEYQWMGFPPWGMVETAQSPVAILLANCADTPAVVRASNAKTDDDKKRLEGPGMVLCDRVFDSELSQELFYCIKTENGKIDVVEGTCVNSEEVVGVALFVCRPPDRESPIDELEF